VSPFAGGQKSLDLVMDPWAYYLWVGWLLMQVGQKKRRDTFPYRGEKYAKLLSLPDSSLKGPLD